jgi:molecular chaperone DnaJ
MGLLDSFFSSLKKPDGAEDKTPESTDTDARNGLQDRRPGSPPSDLSARKPPVPGDSQGEPGGKTLRVDLGGMDDIFRCAYGLPEKTGPRPGTDLFTSVRITSTAAAAGTVVGVEVTRSETCTSCEGSGSRTRQLSPCPHCNGKKCVKKEIRHDTGSIVHTLPCPGCQGRGVIPVDPCRECGGTGQVQKTRTIPVPVPAGTRNFQQICVEGEGNAGEDPKKNGNLILMIKVR